MGQDADRRTPATAPPRGASTARHPDGFGEDRETVVAVFGDTTRAGAWLPPERLHAVAGFGNVTLDFTQAELPPGPTEVRGFAVFGNVELRVPADVDVEQSGISLFGKITHRSQRRAGKKLFERLRKPPESLPAEPDDDEDRWLVVTGWAVFGNLRVIVIEP